MFECSYSNSKLANVGSINLEYDLLVIHQYSGFVEFFDSDLKSKRNSHLLGRKEIALFNLMFEKMGSPISRDDILDVVWNGRVVGSNTLSVAVSHLRRLLAKVGRSDDIVTLGRFGYMLDLADGKYKAIEVGKLQLIP